MTFPQVAGEFETVTMIAQGYSIARFGDGELKMMDGFGYTRTNYKPVPGLTQELRRIVSLPHPKCLIGIPTMDPTGLKYEGWKRHRDRFTKFFREGDGNKYYSSLITRPDCGAWMETHEYYLHVCKIWEGYRRITVVSEPESKLLTHTRMLPGVDVTHVECPSYDAYEKIAFLQAAVIESRPQLALLSIGTTATVLAYRLAHHNIHAVDLGSIGGFLMRWRTGKPKPKTRDDYASERTNEPDTHK